MKFPAWAPKQLRDLYSKYEAVNWEKTQENDAKDYKWLELFDGEKVKALLERMLTDAKMERIWKEWDKVESSREDVFLDAEFLFCCVIKHSLYPHSSMTHKQTIDHLQRIANLATELRVLLSENPIFRLNESIQIEARSYISLFHEGEQSPPPFLDMCHALTCIEEEARYWGKAMQEPHFHKTLADSLYCYTPRPKASSAPINHFVHSMSGIFINVFGKQRPVLLARLTQVVFDVDDSVISERQVNRLLERHKHKKV